MAAVGAAVKTGEGTAGEAAVGEAGGAAGGEAVGEAGAAAGGAAGGTAGEAAEGLVGEIAEAAWEPAAGLFVVTEANFTRQGLALTCKPHSMMTIVTKVKMAGEIFIL